MLLNSLALASNVFNLNKSGVIAEGYDVVSYFKPEGPLKGEVQFQAKHKEATYLFANEENKQAFLKEPEKYAPQFGGWCAYAVAEKKSKVEIDPKSFLIQDGRLLLFYNGFLSDTKKKWLNNKSKDAKEYLKQADMNWSEIKDQEP
jgi:YHS domain-containing protein